MKEFEEFFFMVTPLYTIASLFPCPAKIKLAERNHSHCSFFRFMHSDLKCKCIFIVPYFISTSILVSEINTGDKTLHLPFFSTGKSYYLTKTVHDI